MENEDVVGAAPTGDAPTMSEWSTIWLPTKVRLILETWRYMLKAAWNKIMTWSMTALIFINCYNDTYIDHFVYAPSQWEMPLQCNVIYHWLDAYTKWSLHLILQTIVINYTSDRKWHSARNKTRTVAWFIAVLDLIRCYWDITVKPLI